MRRILVLLFLFSVLTADAQLVRDVCSTEKLAHDSAMYHEYGELFYTHFEFDSSDSHVGADPNHLCMWNDSMYGDTVQKYVFFYTFHFPGALVSPGNVYGPAENTNGELVTDLQPYAGHCLLMGQQEMDSIAQRNLHKPIGKCSVMLYPFYFYDWGDYSHHLDLDSTHIFLEVTYNDFKGSGRRGTKFISTDRTIVVDGCTGEVLGPAKKTVYKGVIGGKF
jgi:hypothetical protein